MKFFTDKTVINDYLLIKIGDYRKVKDFSRWKEVFIDPGVYELIKEPEYSWFQNNKQIVDFLDSLPSNHYFSLDYPCDMNIFHTDYFLRKSWSNAKRYCIYPHYIVTVQSKFHDYMSFVEWFDKYNALDIKSGIMGLGNICRILQKTQYIKHALPYAFKNCRHPRIHIYGLAFKNIEFTMKLADHYGIELSIDSTKWTRACTVELKKKYNINCNGKNRQEFFDEYLKQISLICSHRTNNRKKCRDINTRISVL